MSNPRLPRPRLRRRAVGAVGGGARREERLRARRQPVDLRGVGDDHAPRLRRVEHVVRELGRELGELHPVGVELLLRTALERDARQLHPLQRRLQDPPLRLVERARAREHVLDRRVDGGALRQLRRRLHHLGLHLAVRRAQLVRVLHAHQVAHHAPRVLDRRLDPLERLDDVGVRDVRLRRRERALERGELAVEALQQLLDRRRHVLRRDRVEPRQRVLLQQRVVEGGGGRLGGAAAEAGGHARRWAEGRARRGAES